MGGTATIHPEPPQFQGLVTRRVSPNMAVVCLKCNSFAWAHSYTNGISGNPFPFSFASSLLWRSLNAALVFDMKNDSVLGVLKANLFVRLLHSKDATSAELVYALPVRARSFFRSFARFSCRFILHFHVSLVVDCSKKCLAGVAVWRSVLLRPCLSTFFLRWWLPSFWKKSRFRA